MNHSLALMGILGAALFTSVAQAAPTDRYASAQLTLPNVTGFSGGLAITGDYGMPMSALVDTSSMSASVRDNLFFEAEGSVIVSDPSTTFFGTKVKTSYFTAAAYAVYRKELRNGASIHGRLGLLYENVSVSAGGSGYSASASGSSTGLSYGIGMLYPLKKDMSLRADYTVVEADISHISIGVQMPLH